MVRHSSSAFKALWFALSVPSPALLHPPRGRIRAPTHSSAPLAVRPKPKQDGGWNWFGCVLWIDLYGRSHGAVSKYGRARFVVCPSFLLGRARESSFGSDDGVGVGYNLPRPLAWIPCPTGTLLWCKGEGTCGPLDRPWSILSWPVDIHHPTLILGFVHQGRSIARALWTHPWTGLHSIVLHILLVFG